MEGWRSPPGPNLCAIFVHACASLHSSLHSSFHSSLQIFAHIVAFVFAHRCMHRGPDRRRPFHHSSRQKHLRHKRRSSRRFVPRRPDDPEQPRPERHPFEVSLSGVTPEKFQMTGHGLPSLRDKNHEKEVKEPPESSRRHLCEQASGPFGSR